MQVTWRPTIDHPGSPALARGILLAVLAWFAFQAAPGIWGYGTGPPERFDSLFRERYVAWLPVVVAHGVSGVLALLLGLPTFLPISRRLGVHRWLGRAYAASVAVASVTGLHLASMAHGGTVARTGFASLSAAWALTLAVAVVAARRRRFAVHRAWMIRCYALTFGAVLSRIYLDTLQQFGWTFDVIYPWVAWMSWLPNLVAAEIVVQSYDLGAGRAPQPMRRS